MLQQARRRPEDVSLLQADAMEIPLQTASIDFAICSFAVSYMASIDRLARELSRVMRNQGQSCLVLTDIHPSAQARGWKRRFRHRGAIVEVSNFPRPIERTQQAFAAMGLEPVACLEPAFGETERPIFERCGKTAVFRQLLGQPAIIVLLFRRAQ
jgi:ubiquinone/menaquinone biosynthesis C-methylase UbiE